uniref:Uncharacterized protein n=1 Tax=Opuntia streptacantha TaxID=393608 RepID=A0A7C9A915_OPUST
MLFDKSKLNRTDELQIDKPIGPLNLLFEAKKARRLLEKTGNAPGSKILTPGSSGILPEKLLLLKSIHISRRRLPICGGMLPLNLFPLRCNTRRLEKFAMRGGSIPLS